MASQPLEVHLQIKPRQRFQIIDVAAQLRNEVGSDIDLFRKAIYCSLHTTAGYLEQGVCARLGHSPKQLAPLFRAVQRIFPHNAGYFHDRMQLRDELTDTEKQREPVNADSHLTFISAGLKNCVTYVHKPAQPVYFIELDGLYQHHQRHRHTTVLAYDDAKIVHRERLAIPVSSGHLIDSFNLKDPQHGLFSELESWLDRFGVEKGQFDLRLAPEERHAGLTVNEYETLLMRNDLPGALRDPLRYMVQHGKQLLRNPAAIPGKTHDYASFDLIRLYNELMNIVPLRGAVDRMLSALSSPACRILRLKRHITLLVSNSEETGEERIVQGTYQSPILVQHQTAVRGMRHLDVTLRSFS